MSTVTSFAEITYPQPEQGEFPKGRVFYVAVDIERPVRPEDLLPILTQNGCLVLGDGHRLEASLHVFKIATYLEPTILAKLLHDALSASTRCICLARSVHGAVEGLLRGRVNQAGEDGVVIDVSSLLTDEAAMKAIQEAGEVG